jgi:hypothetical protein
MRFTTHSRCEDGNALTYREGYHTPAPDTHKGRAGVEDERGELVLPHMFDAVHKGFDGILAPQQLVVLDLLEEERAVVEGGGEAGAVVG